MRDIAWHVQSHGWSVVALPEDGALPGWAYSVGMWHTLRAPEVCMFGLRLADMHHWVNRVGDRVRGGLSLAPGTSVDGILDGYALAVRPVHSSWHADLFAYGLDFHRGPLPMVQLVWPELGSANRQPSLWLPKDDHPPSLWTRLDQLVDSPFPGAAPDSLVLGSRAVIDGSAPVAGVVHGSDGSWSFLDGSGGPEVGVVHLRHVVADHPYVCDFADLPPGYAAWQEPDGNWSRSRVD
ncbi:uncharacterized protein DUF4262 [Actinophytocola oryzae]|uniref:Uncharacterized protein DUF4262 n=2 Tax=Actinophytocola oryzae TaxID=502181 RepID=A0A4V3FS58_9PSEU|nr:uncharacterized protein DUF4262 [Actinophytocola oryzae]